MVDFRTEELFFGDRHKACRKWWLTVQKNFFLFLGGDHFQREAIALPNFRLPPKKFVLATCLNVTATFFLNDIIFAMKSHAVQILCLTLFLKIES